MYFVIVWVMLLIGVVIKQKYPEIFKLLVDFMGGWGLVLGGVLVLSYILILVGMLVERYRQRQSRRQRSMEG